MIVDFPSEKQKADERLHFESRIQLRRASPFLSMIKWHFQHEGETASYTTIDGELRESSYSVSEATVSDSVAEIPEMTVDDIRGRVAAGVADVASQTARGAFATLGEEIERAGNLLQVADPFSPGAYLQMLDRTDVDFDEARDKPELPQLIAHPSQQARLRERWSAMTADELNDFKRRVEEILDRKYAEYVSRENARTLVD